MFPSSPSAVATGAAGRAHAHAKATARHDNPRHNQPGAKPDSGADAYSPYVQSADAWAYTVTVTATGGAATQRVPLVRAVAVGRMSD
ncbi:hypothetical protein V495_08068 [Pseudogymnoascus sp. VKM F-4514 (FW-929)]|nr:hypothetical protein V495_08068 [Pseudogymnoascus sp. VKM F-4514 (FW-929)]KFY51343.1 hypothetical protein V497_09218 [Pseudogymnoascus sp. VKM F-4516 (FW-969)]